MFQVGEVARRLGLNPQTLYFYERIGLMPSPQRTAAGYRLYAQADLDRLTFITQAKTLGLSLDDIKELLALQDGQRLSCREVQDRLRRKMEQIDDTIRNLQVLKAHLSPLLEQCQRGAAQPTEGQQCVVFQTHSLTESVSLDDLD